MRLIDAEALKKVLAETTYNFRQIPIKVNEVMEIIDNAPTVHDTINVYPSGEVIVQETRPQGEWSFKDNGRLIRFQGKWQYTTGGNWGCSNCRAYTNHKYNYCPYCGAQMDKGGEV